MKRLVIGFLLCVSVAVFFYVCVNVFTQKLIEEGMSVFERSQRDGFREDSGETLLTWAVRHYGKEAAMLQEIINSGVDLDEVNSKDETALIIAVQMRNLEAAKMLIDAGANVNVCDRFLDTVLMVALRNCLFDLAQDLIERCGADLNLRSHSGNNALMYAQGGAIWFMKYDQDLQSVRKFLNIIKLLKAHGAEDGNPSEVATAQIQNFVGSVREYCSKNPGDAGCVGIEELMGECGLVK